MSLRDSIKDLKRVAKTLDAANFNFEMLELAKFVDGIKFEGTVKPPEDVLKNLLNKFLRGERNFSSREVRYLPYIIYELQINFFGAAEILDELDFSRASHLRGVVSVYLLNHDESNKTELLRRELHGLRNVDSPSFEKIFAAREYLFGNERFDNMRKLFAEKLSVERALENVGLSNFYKASNFIQTSLKKFFRSDNLPAQMKILAELDAEYDTYKNIFPAVADSVIQTVARVGSFKQQCIEIFYRRLGDPRFGNSRFNWDNVSQRSRDIFCHWLSEEDLEVFFKLVQATALDKQWRYREKFWRAYLPYIVNTKIFLGSTARRIAANLEGVKLQHGNLQSADDSQSVFIFQIGKYIFSEWSHNGKLRIHEPQTHINLFDTAESFFERNYINRDVLVENFIAEWIHHSPQTNSWQFKVSNWIKQKCSIDKMQKDWGLEN